MKTLQAAGPLYSPRPPSDYSRLCPQVGRIGVGVELSGPEDRAAWNLYYLSDPGVDAFIGNWDTTPGPDLDMLKACCRSLRQSLAGRTVAEHVLSLKPCDFAALLSSEAHTHLEPYQLAQRGWIETVQRRAALFRGVVRTAGSVEYAQFGGRPTTKVTSGQESAIIMPLSLRKI